MGYVDSNEAGRLMDGDYDAVTQEMVRRERLRHEAASMPRNSFDGEFLFGKLPRRRYETPLERQLREAAERRENEAAEDG